MADYVDSGVTIYCGDAREVLKRLPDESVNCCVTSPPYWGLRDYGTVSWEGGVSDCEHVASDRYYTEKTAAVSSAGAFSEAGEANAERLKKGRWRESGQCTKCGATRIDRQIGLEETPVKYISTMREVFAEVRRVLRADGTLWMNIGDSYASNAGTDRKPTTLEGPDVPSGWSNRCQPTRVGIVSRGKRIERGSGRWGGGNMPAVGGLKPKDLVGIPWMLAFALREDGWYLRQDIIWSKPNPMPESVTDRCTKAHEYLFLLSKSERYFFNQDAIAEPCIAGDNGSSYLSEQDVLTKDNLGQGPRTIKRPKGWASGKDHTAVGWAQYSRQGRNGSEYTEQEEISTSRNRRSVWNVSTQPFPEAHFATFPEDLIKPCILAGCPEGGTVLDPFIGSGTTSLVARKLHCKAIGIELNAEYIEIAKRRLRQSVFDFNQEHSGERIGYPKEPYQQQLIVDPEELGERKPAP